MDEKFTKLLISRGLPPMYLNGNGEYNFKSITVQRGRNKLKEISVTEMKALARKIISKPLSSDYVIAISSVPTDKQAMILASRVFKAAVEDEKPGKRSVCLNSSYKEWWDKKGKVGFLMLWNVTADSTPFRLERVRDILTTYSDIPRIVVVGGMDGLTFFDKKLYHPITSCIHFSNDLII